MPCLDSDLGCSSSSSECFELSRALVADTGVTGLGSLSLSLILCLDGSLLSLFGVLALD